MSTYKFTVERNGKVYNCYAEVEGKRVFRQTITVEGVGTKIDGADYGNSARYHPVAGMKSVAKLVAWEIINNRYKY